jgi:hypothetical protein
LRWETTHQIKLHVKTLALGWILWTIQEEILLINR